MNILLCSVPDGAMEHTKIPLLPRGNGFKKFGEATFSLLVPTRPLGLLRLLIEMEKNDYTGDIYDINNLRHSDEEIIENFKKVKPDVVGLSAVLSHCYPNVKRITKILRKLNPNVWIVLGGHLTSSSDVLLRRTETDVCVIGDGEISFVKLLDYFKSNPRNNKNREGLKNIKGLAFIDGNDEVLVTGNSEQLPASKLEYPNYDILRDGLEKFAGKGEMIHEFFEPISKEKKLGTRGMSDEVYEIVKGGKIAEEESARGCVARCTFCQRYVKGYRTYSALDFESHILNLKKKYGVKVVRLIDENALSNKKQSYEVARVMKKCGVLWQAWGVRVKSVNYEDLKFFKETGMYDIRFGIETGSQKMMDVMEKKFKVKDVVDRVKECQELGINMDSDGVIVGMPGETKETMMETGALQAKFRYIKGEDWSILNPEGHWALAIPGTPLFEYAQQIGAIGKTLDEKEDYIYRLAGEKNNFLNYTNYLNIDVKELYSWNYFFTWSGKYAYKDLIRKDNKSILKRWSQYYKMCFKPEIDMFSKSVKYLFNKRKLYNLPKFIMVILNHIILKSLCLGILFLPKKIIFPLLKIYSDLRFNILAKKHKVKNGKQKYNVFMERKPIDITDLQATKERLNASNRSIDKSLRTVVNDNRKRLKMPISMEEKGIEILNTGQ